MPAAAGNLNWMLLVLFVCGLFAAPLSGQTTPEPIPDDPNPLILSYVAGGREFGEGGPALTAFIADLARGIEVDSQGRVYIGSNSYIWRVEQDGTIQTLATVFPLTADLDIRDDVLYYLGFPTLEERHRNIYAMDINTGVERIYTTVDPGVVGDCCSAFTHLAVDSAGDVYLTFENRIYRIDAQSGETTHVAGNGEEAYSNPGGLATEASFRAENISIDPTDDTLLIADALNRRILRLLPQTGELLSSGVLDVLSPNGWLYAIQDVQAHPSGDVYFTSPDNNRIYRLSAQLDSIGIVAGNGSEGPDGDGGSVMKAAIKPSKLAIAANGDYFFSSGRFYQNLRVRHVDAGRDVVTTTLGQPGFLGCASPLDSFLVFSSGIHVDSDGIIYTQSYNSVLAIDTEQSLTYPVGGIYGNLGDSPDGVPAFGNPLNMERTPYSGIAVTPEGRIYLAERGNIRTIDEQTGILSTLARGSYRMPFYHPVSGRLFAIRDHGDWSDFVEIDPATGQVTDLVTGGPQTPVVGESAGGRKFMPVIIEDGAVGGRNLHDFAVDREGNFYLSINDQLAPDFPSGVYRIDAGTGTLRAVFQEAADSTRAVLGQLALDEDRGILYYTWAGESDFFGNGEYVPVVKVDLASGERTRFAGMNALGISYCRECSGQNALDALLMLIDITVAPNGDLYLLQNQDEVLRISATGQSAFTVVPEDIGAGSAIGNAVASHKDWLAIGVPNSRDGSGEVLVYQDSDCRPILRERLTMPEGYSGTHFGNSLVFAGDNLVIGSRGLAPPVNRLKSSDSATGVQTRAENTNPLRVGVFGLKNGRSWNFDTSLADILSPSGNDVEIVADGTTFAVGTPDAGQGMGEVVVFEADNLDEGVSVVPPVDFTQSFGKSIALSDGRLAVGSGGDDAGGLVDVWEIEGGQFTHTATLEQPLSGFATALALNDTALYVGSPDDEGGRVFDYALGEGGIDLADTLVDPNDETNTSFGSSLALEDGLLVVGAPQSSVSPSSKAGRPAQTQSTGASSGLVFAFGVKDSSGRRQLANTLFSRLMLGAEAYGHSVDVSNGRIVVGAPETNEGTGSFDPVDEIADSAGLSGLWYDPDLDGEGFNILVTDVGMIVFFYGYDTAGQRLWLISDVLSSKLTFGETLNVPMYKATIGEFDSPVKSSEALVQWGLLTMTYGSLNSATMILNGFDGSKVSKAVFLADVTAAQARYSGLWFEPALDGEGFNVIAARVGTVIYYYGSNAAGERLWLISDVLQGELSDGVSLTGRIYEAVGGDFFHPEPSSSSLRDWGSIEARFDTCDSGRIVLTGKDGSKTSEVIKLVGVKGAGCG